MSTAIFVSTPNIDAAWQGKQAVNSRIFLNQHTVRRINVGDCGGTAKDIVNAAAPPDTFVDLRGLTTTSPLADMRVPSGMTMV